jgi:hypothetical protein
MSWMIVVVCRLEQSIGNLYRLSSIVSKERTEGTQTIEASRYKRDVPDCLLCSSLVAGIDWRLRYAHLDAALNQSCYPPRSLSLAILSYTNLNIGSSLCLLLMAHSRDSY